MRNSALAALAVLIATASAVPQINVQLEVRDNTRVRAVISNVGDDTFNAITRDGLLSKAAIQKVHVSSQDGDVSFKGPRVYFDNRNLKKGELQIINPGESIERQFDLAESFDLSKGGDFTIASRGSIQYSDQGEIKSVRYMSNTLTTSINGEMASEVHKSHIAKRDSLIRRANIDGDCTGEKRDPVTRSIKNTHDLALAAAKSARTGPASRMEKVFGRSDKEARDLVAGAFDNMVKLYSSDSNGIPAVHCTDVDGTCKIGATAYVIQEKSIVVFCDPWFDYPEKDDRCSKHDQSVIAVHEASHLLEVKGTVDADDPSDNTNSADSYGQFAHQVSLNCPS